LTAVRDRRTTRCSGVEAAVAIKVGVVGATGYTGVELLRLLLAHPQVDLVLVTSRSEKGRPVADLFPSLRGHTDLRYTLPDAAALKECQAVFFATPNGTTMHQAAELLDAGVRIVDLSADFRIRDAAVWKQWYGQEHASPALLKRAVYGLPELYRDRIRAADLVANPGCYPTAVSLALLPLLRADAIESHGLVADAKSGVSGAGRKAELEALYGETSESFRAYKAGGHRHLPEIRQTLEDAAGTNVELTFVPHLVPMVRGIHATVYATLRKGADAQEILSGYYAREPFVDVLPPGSHPETRSVRGTNVCRIAAHSPGASGRVVVLSVIDNLVKGAAGQAVQNMNLMFDLPEVTGLSGAAVVP
jgi:N-acetyl-gamma-glutamyl-phosphate reductase